MSYRARFLLKVNLFFRCMQPLLPEVLKESFSVGRLQSIDRIKADWALLRLDIGYLHMTYNAAAYLAMATEKDFISDIKFSGNLYSHYSFF
jgi:hypothetical protein